MNWTNLKSETALNSPQRRFCCSEPDCNAKQRLDPQSSKAGQKKLFLGGHNGAFNNKHHGGNAYNHNAKAKARARENAKARATASRSRDGGPTESNTAAAPSTAAVLTKSELDADADTRVKKSPDDKVTVATSTDDGTADTASSIGEGACKKFAPEVGTAVAVPCD